MKINILNIQFLSGKHNDIEDQFIKNKQQKTNQP